MPLNCQHRLGVSRLSVRVCVTVLVYHLQPIYVHFSCFSFLLLSHFSLLFQVWVFVLVTVSTLILFFALVPGVVWYCRWTGDSDGLPRAHAGPYTAAWVRRYCQHVLELPQLPGRGQQWERHRFWWLPPTTRYSTQNFFFYFLIKKHGIKTKCTWLISCLILSVTHHIFQRIINLCFVTLFVSKFN